MTAIDPNKLKNSLLGEELDDDDLATLAKIMDSQALSDGEELVPENGVDDRLFLLAEGRLEVWSSQQGDQERVYTMRPGEFAGTRAFIDHSPRQAMLRAHGDAKVYSLKPKDFEALLDDHPKVVYKVMRSLFRITHVNLMRMNNEARELANYVYKRGGRY